MVTFLSKRLTATIVGVFALLGAVASASMATAATAQGELVTTYGTGGVATVTPNSSGLAAVRQSDNKVVSGGLFSTNILGLTRLTAAGALDTSFNASGPTPGKVELSVPGLQVAQFGGIAIQNDNRILVFGDLQDPTNANRADWVVARYTTSGALDTSFNAGLGYRVIGRNDEAEFAGAIAVAPDGKIVLAGARTQIVAGTDETTMLVRLTSSGALDATFGNGGQAIFDFASSFNENPKSLLVDSAGTMTLAGTDDTSRLLVARVTRSGAVDTHFAASGATPGWRLLNLESATNVAQQIIRDSAGRYVVVGSTSAGSGYGAFLLRLDSNGNTDTSFAPSSGHPGWLVFRLGSTATRGFGVVQDFQGRYVMAGNTVVGFPVSGAMVTRFTQSGTLDESFAQAASVPGAFVYHPVSADSNATQALVLLPGGDLIGVGYGYQNSSTIMTQAIKLQGEAPPAPLPDTGQGPGGVLGWAFALLGSGTAVLVVSRKQKRGGLVR